MLGSVVLSSVLLALESPKIDDDTLEFLRVSERIYRYMRGVR